MYLKCNVSTILVGVIVHYHIFLALPLHSKIDKTQDHFKCKSNRTAIAQWSPVSLVHKYTHSESLTYLVVLVGQGFINLYP